MADENQNQNQNQNAPWYEGKADAELVGHLTNKGWNAKPAADVAIEAIRAHREAERLIGVPASQVVRLPTDPNDEAGWKGVWQRLGAPANGKDGYDFSSIKDAAGAPVVSPVLDTVRNVAAELNLPKDHATKLANAVLKFDNDRAAAAAAEATAKIEEGRKALRDNWGTNHDVNLVVAKQAAAALGVDPEAVAALEKVVGYDKVMELFRTIGSKIGEDKFVKDPSGQTPGVMSKGQARARLDELKADKAYTESYLGGDAAKKREMAALHAILAA